MVFAKYCVRFLRLWRIKLSVKINNCDRNHVSIISGIIHEPCDIFRELFRLLQFKNLKAANCVFIQKRHRASQACSFLFITRFQCEHWLNMSRIVCYQKFFEATWFKCKAKFAAIMRSEVRSTNDS